jgi:hypothetical protein
MLTWTCRLRDALETRDFVVAKMEDGKSIVNDEGGGTRLF